MQDDLGGIISQVLVDVADAEELKVGSFTCLCDVKGERHGRVKSDTEVFCYM